MEFVMFYEIKMLNDPVAKMLIKKDLCNNTLVVVRKKGNDKLDARGVSNKVASSASKLQCSIICTFAQCE